MKIEITQRGCFGPEGEYPVGCIIDVEGDAIPASFVNKARPVGRVAVTNPASGALPGATAQPDLKAKAKALGIKGAHLMKGETLAAKIAEAEAQ